MSPEFARGPRWAAGLVALLLVTVVGTSWAAEQVKIRAWPHSGFGRIVFDWPAPVSYTAEIVEGDLIVRFIRPLETNPVQVTRYLGDYVSAVDTEPDGRALRFALTGAFDLRTSATGTSIVIDLRQRAGADAKTDTPSEAATTQETLPRLGVRTGVHSGYTRVVFDWSRDVDYRVDTRDNRVVVDFARAANADLSRLASQPPRWITAATQRVEGGRLKVELGIPAGHRVRHFRVGTKVVVDVLPSTTTAADTSATQAATTTTTAAPKATKSGKVERSESPSIAAAEPKGESAGAPTPLVPPEQDGAATTARQDAAHDARQDTGPNALSVTVKEDGGHVQVAFDWQSPVAAAVFQRAGFVWAVFDRATDAKIAPVSEELSEVVFLVEQAPNPTATVIRMRAQPGLAVTTARRGASWLVNLVPDEVAPKSFVEIKREPDSPQGPRVFIPLRDAGNRVEVEDPEVGDLVYAVPIATPAGVIAKRGFMEFDLLATSQGVVINPRADGLAVKPVRSGLEITSEDGLLLSKAVDLPPGALAADGSGSTPQSVYQYEEWRRGPLSAFTRTRNELQGAAARVPKGGRNAARWDLARFYFAHGFAQEALGVLNVMAEDDPLASEDPDFRAVRGATLFLLRRYDEAAGDLFHEDLESDTGVALWRGGVAAARGDWAHAIQEFAFGAASYPLFPEEIQGELRLRAAQAAWEGEDMDALDRDLTVLVDQASTPRLQNEAQILLAQVLRNLGDTEGAVHTLDAVIDTDYRPTRGRAILAQTEMLLEDGEITQEEAAKRLDALRFSWRGGEFEFQLLQRLGELYMDVGDYRRGLSAWREVVTYFPDNPRNREVAKAMGDTFRRLFLDGEADGLQPVNAVALYYDFRELTPVGRDGDAMIRDLANRLASVDLLERAAQLLEHQVRFRLQGEERSRVASRLAVIHLLDKKPLDALRILRTTNWRGLSAELSTQRRHLEARALADLNRDDEALSLLRPDNSRGANLIRADIHWHRDEWREMAGSLDAALGNRWQEAEPLSEIERHQIMRLAVALSLAGDAQGIANVRRRYLAKMADSPDAHAFELLSKTIDNASTAFRELSGAIAQLDTIDAFLESYRATMADGGLSAIN